MFKKIFERLIILDFSDVEFSFTTNDFREMIPGPWIEINVFISPREWTLN